MLEPVNRLSAITHLREVIRLRVGPSCVGSTDQRRAAVAHDKHEKCNGEHDANWPAWYATYMAAEQAGTELPR